MLLPDAQEGSTQDSTHRTLSSAAVVQMLSKCEVMELKESEWLLPIDEEVRNIYFLLCFFGLSFCLFCPICLVVLFVFFVIFSVFLLNIQIVLHVYFFLRSFVHSFFFCYFCFFYFCDCFHFFFIKTFLQHRLVITKDKKNHCTDVKK